MNIHTFHKQYMHTYPDDLHLKYELRYFMIKYHIASEIIHYILHSNKKEFVIGDIGGGYGYDDLLIQNLLHESHPEITLQIEVIDPTINFYNDVHQLTASDIRAQQGITYIQQSLIDLDPAAYREKYDIIICSEVIEHLLSHEQEIFFAQFNRLLKQSGLVLLTTPNGSTVLKQLYGILHRKQWKKEIFEAEFHYRYSHIGVPTIFQVLWLFLRKWFSVQQIYPSALVSNTKVSRLNYGIQKILLCIPYINVFFSTSNVFVASKSTTVDDTKRYNAFSF